MFQWLGHLPIIAGAPIFIGVLTLAAIGGGILFHRVVPHGALAEHNEIAGFVFAVVGVIYAVLLAFLAVGAWEHLQNAEEQTYDEAARLIVVYRKCDAFPQGPALRRELRAYVSEIANRDWPMMRYGQIDERVIDMGEHIAYQLRRLPVKTMAQQNEHAAMVASMDQALIDRDSREAVSNTGIGVFLWGILFAGGFFTVVFSYLFAYRNTWSLIGIVGLLAAMVALLLYLVAAVDYPFQGEIRVGPDAFEHALRVFSKIGR